MARMSLYPPSPPDVPEDLARPTSEYRLQVGLVLFSVGLFFLLYFAIMICSGAFVAWAIFGKFDPRFGHFLVARIIFAIPMGLLCAYLVKNLFLRHRPGKSYDIELDPEDHPRLFEFIEKICDEVGAPYPKSVYVNFEVNAFAMQDVSLLRLFIPSRKSLLIGLGLVNAINLTEFKALLAHEFGHFSQKGMALGAHVGTALAIVDNVVHGRDCFDDMIDRWRQMEIRIAFPAWVFWVILWVLRRLLIGLQTAIFFFSRAQSRQAELNADLVAVSVTGSDAPVHLLYRSTFGERCLRQALADLQTALDHHLYTSNLFYHQNHAADYLRRREKKPQLGEPPALPKDVRQTTQVFERDDDAVAEMWATHPSNNDREENAKRHYIRTEFDERSPWLLFDDVDELRRRVTNKFYRICGKIPKDSVLEEPEKVQAFIDEERAEATYDAKYHGLFDCRNLMIEDLEALAQEAKKAMSVPGLDELAQAHAGMFDIEVKHRAQLHYARLKEHNLLLAVVNGWHRPRDDEIGFRGDVYEASDAKKLLRKVEKELEKDFEWLKRFDARLFTAYFQMAQLLDTETAQELFQRYRFHLQLQKLWQDLRTQEESLQNALNFLCNQKSGQLQANHFQEVLAIFRTAHRTLKDRLREAEAMLLPALKNLAEGKPLRDFLLEARLIDGLSEYETSLKPKWIDKLRSQYQEVKQKADRIHYKSLGRILALQERIAADCLQRLQAPCAKQ